MKRKKVSEALERERVLIVMGKAGVGKTRLALEAAKEYQEKSGCRLFCIKCNHMPIMEDLCRYISGAGKYLIFVDDANELAGMCHLLEYIIRNDVRYDVRIIATVRDYISRPLINEISRVIEPNCIRIPKFTDHEIREFIKLNLKIQNTVYLNQIVKIAKGNPRIAYMAGKLAVEKKDLRSIMNMEGLYKSYYSCFLESTSILTDSKLSLTAGILSIFNAVNLENLDKIDELFDVIGMDKEEFIENIHALYDLEYVEVRFEKVARISEQCLSNYMLYFAFFVKKMVRFSDVLRVGFRMFRNSIVKSVKTLLNIFYSDEMKDYMDEEINEVWNEFETDEKTFYEFVKTFHCFNPEETLIYVNKKIEEADACEIDILSLSSDKRNWNVNIDDQILQLLAGYRKSDYLTEAIELVVKYCIKKQDIVKVVYSLIESYYSINMYSVKEEYNTQNIVINIIRENIGIPVIKKLFYQVAGLYLSLLFRSVEAEDEGSFTSYQIEVELLEGSRKYRSNIWKEIISLSKYEENVEDVFNFLCSYPGAYARDDLQMEVVRFDWKYIILILENLWQYVESFRFAYIYSRLLEVENVCSDETINTYDGLFEIEEWKLYKVLSGRFYMDIINFAEKETALKANIKNYIECYSSDKMEDIVKNISGIIRMLGSEKAGIKGGIDSLCEVLTHDKERLWIFVSAYFKYGNNFDLPSEMIVDALLKHFGCQAVFDSIWNTDFSRKRKWQFDFFEMIDCEVVTQENYRQFMCLIEKTESVNEEEIFHINLRMLDKLEKYSSDIYTSVTRILLNKIGDNIDVLSMYFSSLFNQNCYTPDELLKIYYGMEEDLKFIYFRCLKKYRLTDYTGIFLGGFVLNDIDWIKCYAHYIQDKCENYEIVCEEHRMDICWEQDDYLEIFDTYVDELFRVKTLFWIGTSHLQNVLSLETKKEIGNRKVQWILHYIRERCSSENVIELFMVLQEMGADIREKAILCFLEYNSDIEMFKRLSMVSNSWSGKDDLTDKIMFYEDLLPEIRGVKFLEHKKFIKEQIQLWKHVRNNEELDRILCELYE